MTADERTRRVAEQPSADVVAEGFDAVSAALPKGWRAELIEGEIHVTPPANGEHEEIVARVSRQVARKTDDLLVFTGLGLLIRSAATHGRFIPDIVIAPEGSFMDDREYHEPGPVLLVGEVTSASTGRIDRTEKLRAYARAGIPTYLLIDRDEGCAVMHSEPSGSRYTRTVTAEFDKSLALPEPFGFDLDTSAF